jgi:hypothetical protein
LLDAGRPGILHDQGVELFRWRANLCDEAEEAKSL